MYSRVGQKIYKNLSSNILQYSEMSDMLLYFVGMHFPKGDDSKTSIILGNLILEYVIIYNTLLLTTVYFPEY